MPRDDTAAYAANWRTILVVDLVVGLLPVALGLLSTSVWGLLPIAAGVAYLVLVIRRARRWRRLRADAGL